MNAMLRKTGTAIIALIALAHVGAQHAAPLHAQTGITIYNDGRVFVRRTFPLRVPAGTSSQSLALGMADPATIFSLDPEVTIERATYDAAVDEESVLRRAVGKRLVFRVGSRTDGIRVNDTVSALVLGVDPLRLQMPGGRIAFTMPGQPLYPPELVLAEPAMSLMLRSDGARPNLRLGYFSSGARWQAAYSVILGGGSAARRLGGSAARVVGNAVVRSDALRIEDAELQLLAGDVGRAAESTMVYLRAPRAMEAAAYDMAANKMSEQRVGEFHLYSLPGRHTLLPGQTTSASLFAPANVAYERNYVIRGEIPFWGYLPQHPEENDVPVEVSYTLKRPRNSGFGDRPLPGGVARLYEADSAGRMQLVGEASTDHTPAGEDLRLSAGTAFDLTATRVQTSYTTRRDSVPGGWRTTVNAEYRVTISNATDSAAVVDVHERRGGDWRVISSSVPADKVSSTLTRFRVTVPPRGQAVLTYQVRITW